MHFAAVGGLKGDGADGALVEDLAVLLLHVHLLPLEGLEDHITVKTSGREDTLTTPRSRPRDLDLARLHSLVPGLAGVVEAVFLHVLLDVGGAAQGSALRAAVRRLVGVKALVGSEAALVGEQHGARVAHLV